MRVESCCAILPPSMLYSAPQPLLGGPNPTPATTAILSLQRLFSNFSLQSEKRNDSCCFLAGWLWIWTCDYLYCKNRSWSSYCWRYFDAETFSASWDFLAPASLIPIQPCTQHSKHPIDAALRITFACTDTLKSGISYLQLEIGIC